MSETLKPCPFCGNPADTTFYEEGGWSVGCDTTMGCCILDTSFPTEAEAIAAWNRRAPEPHREDVEALVHGVVQDILHRKASLDADGFWVIRACDVEQAMTTALRSRQEPVEPPTQLQLDQARPGPLRGMVPAEPEPVAVIELWGGMVKGFVSPPDGMLHGQYALVPLASPVAPREEKPE